ncbi:MAG: hypothetical protein KDI75_06110, partial [Xanthomonadales bacterium]|nr:hypothetical protein [Xanthomonadales bacterium]
YNNFPWPELAVPSPAGGRGQGEGGQHDASPSPGAARRSLPPAGAAGKPAAVEAGERTLTASAASKHRQAIEAAAQGVLDARAQFPDATLADLYDPLTMPPALVKAHQQLDRAVDAAYLAAEKAAGRPKPNLATDAERVAFLFQRYQAITSLLPAAKPKKPRRKPASAAASTMASSG